MGYRMSTFLPLSKSFFVNALLLTFVWRGVFCIDSTPKAIAQADLFASMQWWSTKVKKQSELREAVNSWKPIELLV
jgi:hypothetical protein